VVYAAGDIDISTAPQLFEFLEELTGNVVLDLTDVTFLELHGLVVLIAAQRRLLEHRADLRLRNPKVSVRRTLQLAGIHAWIDE
jgi:anti-anti-sigma factor